jgi:hypothetical protein
LLASAAHLAQPILQGRNTNPFLLGEDSLSLPAPPRG